MKKGTDNRRGGSTAAEAPHTSQTPAERSAGAADGGEKDWLEADDQADEAARFEKSGIVGYWDTDFDALELPPFDWIIEGLVAKHLKGDLFAKSKTYKTYFSLQLAWSVAYALPFLDLRIPKPRRVAYFDLELIPVGFQDRFKKMKRELGITCGNNLRIYPLRDSARKLRQYAPQIVAELKREGIDFAIIDPRYKLLTPEEDENSGMGLQGVLDFRDEIAKVCAVLLVGHDPKGTVAGKSMADRGAGSYRAGADCDFAFALAEHEKEGRLVVSFTARYDITPDDITAKYDVQRQLFEIDRDTPATPKQAGAGGTKADPKKKADRNRLKLEDLEAEVKRYVAAHALTAKEDFYSALEATPAGAAFGTRLRDKIKAFAEQGVFLAEQDKLEKKKDGTIGRTGKRTCFYGSPESIARYRLSFGLKEAE